MKRLTEIANNCLTDKGLCFNESHGYTEYYEDWLLRYKSPKILEIGSWHGASTRMFNEFYNGECEIWTYDISYTEYWYDEKPNVHNFTGDQDNLSDWECFFNEAGDSFDIIIDDGSHLPKHQMHTLYWLHNKLTTNGIYIIEDLHTYSWDKLSNSPLYFLNFWNRDNEYLTPAEYDALRNSIKDETIIQISNPENKYGGLSITSILRFK